MPRVKREDDRTEDLLEKLLVFQLFSLGASQARIAKIVGRGKQWVNEMLRGIPRRENDGATTPKKP